MGPARGQEWEDCLHPGGKFCAEATKVRTGATAMLPRAEIENLLTAVFQAVDLAAQGHVADGFEVLLIAKQRALEGEQNFEPWAGELEGRWDAALQRYAARRGV